MIAYIRKHWRGESSLLVSLLLNVPLSIAVPLAVYLPIGNVLLGNVPSDVFGAWFYGGAAIVVLCGLVGVVGAVRSAIRTVRTPGSHIAGRLIAGVLLVAVAATVVYYLAIDIALLLRSR